MKPARRALLLTTALIVAWAGQGCERYLTCDDYEDIDCGEGLAGAGGSESGGAGSGGKGSGGKTSGGSSSWAGDSGEDGGSGGSSAGGSPTGGRDSGGSGAAETSGGSGGTDGGGSGGMRTNCEKSRDCPDTSPICDATTEACRDCTKEDDCADHDASSPYCEETGGRCVECLTSDQCPSRVPVCDPASFSCRTCEHHDECESGACGADGQCVPEAQIVYALAGTGANSLPCGTQENPCRELEDAVSQMDAERSTLVLVETTAGFQLMAGLHFPEHADVLVVGNDAEILSGGIWPTYFVGGTVRLDELRMVSDDSYLAHMIGGYEGAHIVIRDSSFFAGHFAIWTRDSTVDVEGCTFDGLGGYSESWAVYDSCDTCLAKSRIVGNHFQNHQAALWSQSKNTEFSGNLLTRVGTESGAGIIIGDAGARVSFNTIAYSGNCEAEAFIQTPEDTELFGNIAFQTMRPEDGSSCPEKLYGPASKPTYSIAEATFTGTGNLTTSAPGFIDPQGGDFRLRADSPAIDLVPLELGDSESDFDGHPRPVGDGYDAGAFERQD